MYKEIRDEWVAALRSGKYAQTRGKLRKADGYCCLGVLCDIRSDVTWSDTDEDEDVPQIAMYTGDDTWVPSSNELPGELASAIGLSDRLMWEGPAELGHLLSTEEKLMRLNDYDHLSFEEIANWIEQNIEVD